MNNGNTVTAAMMAAASLPALDAQESSPCCSGNDWKEQLIAPIANPIYFEYARITSEVRPIFIEQFLPEQFKYAGGGNCRWGVTPRFTRCNCAMP